MRKRSTGLPDKNSAERKRLRVIMHSRMLFVAALLFLVIVGIGEIFYCKWEMRSHGHLHASFATVVLPFAAVLFVVITLWNWRWILSHPDVRVK